jgi:hypothetical protein
MDFSSRGCQVEFDWWHPLIVLEDNGLFAPRIGVRDGGHI